LSAEDVIFGAGMGQVTSLWFYWLSKTLS